MTWSPSGTREGQHAEYRPPDRRGTPYRHHGEPCPRSAVSVGPGRGAAGRRRPTSLQTGSPSATENPRLWSRKTANANLPHAQNVCKLRHFQEFRTDMRNRWAKGGGLAVRRAVVVDSVAG